MGVLVECIITSVLGQVLLLFLIGIRSMQG